MRHYPGKTAFIPKDPEQARETRLRDRLFDLYLHLPMQKVVTDKLRPAGKNDPHGVEDARAQMHTSLRMLDELMAKRTWAIGEVFTMADCAAAPPLFYIDMVIAARRYLQKRRGVFQAAEGTAVLRTRSQGGAAVFQMVPK